MAYYLTINGILHDIGGILHDIGGIPHNVGGIPRDIGGIPHNVGYYAINGNTTCKPSCNLKTCSTGRSHK